MKKSLFFTAILAVAVIMGACKKDNTDITDGAPVFSNVVVNGNNTEVDVPSEITFSLTLTDKNKLSNMMVYVVADDEVIAESEQYIVIEPSVTFTDEELFIPFGPNMPDGGDITVKFVAENVSGKKAEKEVELTVKRPAITNIYMFLDGAEEGVLMAKSESNEYLYRSPEDFYLPSFNVLFADAADLEDANFIWVSGGEDGEAVIGDADDDPIVGYYPTTKISRINFDALKFKLAVEGDEVIYKMNGKEFAPKDDYLYAKVTFEKDAEIAFESFDNMAESYNRDFFEYDEGTKKMTFIGESGEYDVFYSIVFDYIWVNKMDAVGPEAYWIVGHGFSSSPNWNDGFRNYEWGMEHPFGLGYIYSIGSNKYQTHVWLTLEGSWGMEIEFFSIRDWFDDQPTKDNKNFGITLKDGSLTGDVSGVKVSGSGGIEADAGFQEGYYRLEFDLTTTAEPTLFLERLYPEYKEPIPSGIVLNGSELMYLDDEKDMAYEVIEFTKGEVVPFTVGSEDMGVIYNRDMFSYDGTTLTFLRESGKYEVAYYPAYNYMFVYQDGAAAPDCFWAQGYGYTACPTWHEDFGEFGWSTTSPYSVYVPKIADGVYQVSMYVKADGDGDFGIEFYSARPWSKDDGMTFEATAITGGDAEALFEVYKTENGATGLSASDAFAEGYYRFEFTVAGDGSATVEISAIN